jgi:hypothetical protein
MASPSPDSQFVDELVADIDAYLHRLTLLTDFAEGQVRERIRLARAVDQLAADREAHLLTIKTLDERLRTVNQSLAVRLAHAPRAVWRRIHRPRS